MKNRIIKLGVAVVIVGLPSGTWGQQNSGQQALVPTIATEPANRHLPSPFVAIAADYRIGVSDVAAITVWKVPELSRSVPVRPDGKISLPLMGDVEAAGKTTGELHDVIVDRLKPFIPDPEVTVAVEQINSQKYFVMGRVAHPGSYSLTLPSTVVEALAAAGGFLDWAKTGDIMVVRHMADNQTERIRFSYKDWLKKKCNATELKSGDIIVVP